MNANLNLIERENPAYLKEGQKSLLGRLLTPSPIVLNGGTLRQEAKTNHDARKCRRSF